MNYEEKYKRAMKVMKEFVKRGSITIDFANAVFPELREESEDERIRKALINGFNKLDKSAVWYNGITNAKILDWLEKQSEQKFTDKEIKELLRTEYEKGRADAISEMQKSWSEEDEMFVHGLIRGLAAKRDIHGHTTFSSDCIDITKTISWLKSLKDRIQPQQEKEEILGKLEVKEVDLDRETTHYLLYEHCSPLNEIMHKADLKAEMQYHKDIEKAFKAGFKLGMQVSNKAQKGE